MTCADALPMLLDADLAALAAERASPLGAHLAGCARCRAVMAALLDDTSRLATLAAAHPAPPARITRAVRRTAPWLLPIPLAAAALLAYVGWSRMSRTSVSSPVAPSVAVVHTPTLRAPAAAAAIETPATPAAARVASATVVVEGRRSTPTRIDVGGPTLAQSAAPTPVAYAAGLADAELASADVSTAAGRVVVLRPGSSNITVVWFY